MGSSTTKTTAACIGFFFFAVLQYIHQIFAYSGTVHAHARLGARKNMSQKK
jgi:hypothetical protein